MKVTEYRVISTDFQLLSEIKISPELKAYQDEMPSDESIEPIKESIKENGFDQTKPIECYQDKTGIFYVLRGWTRFTACEELGHKTIPVITLDIPKDKREDFVILDNTARRQMTTEQKKVIARKVLKKSPKKSDLKIASITGLSDKTIKSLREEMVRRSEIPNVPKEDSKGRIVRNKKPRSEIPNVPKEDSNTSQNQPSTISKPSPTKDRAERIKELKTEKKRLENLLKEVEQELKKLGA